jgi:hypothetical protein
MYGYLREDVGSESPLPPGLPPDHVDAVHALIRRTLAGESCQIEMTAIGKNGEPLLVEVRTIPVRYRGATHAITVTRGHTERMAAEAERARLEEQLRQAQKDGSHWAPCGRNRARFNNILTAILGYVVLAYERQEADWGLKGQALSRAGASVGSTRAGPDPAASYVRSGPPRRPQSDPRFPHSPGRTHLRSIGHARNAGTLHEN